jgi:8-oxo-dGTP pyrophosphatase MutT (NUDIX family)
MDERLLERLAARLAEPLPGPAAGSRYVPEPPLAQHYDRPPPLARPAAVLVLLYPHVDGWCLPLTLRPPDLPDHAGQVSLPGGAIEPGESARDAALRELDEELGPIRQEIRLLGRLSPIYVSVSNFTVEPWVGFTEPRPELVPNPAEVEELLEVPLAHLLDEANFGSHRREYQGRPCSAPHFLWQSHRIWGATCTILGELVMILQELQIDR